MELEVSAEPTAYASKPWWRRGFVVVAASGVLLIAAAVAGFSLWPPMTDEERAHVGTWYGYINEHDRHYCWKTEIRRDQTCRIGFRYFSAANTRGADGAALAQVTYKGSVVSESIGTWSIRDGVYRTRTHYPENIPGLWERVKWWVLMQEWASITPEVHEYAVRPSEPGHFVYHYPAGGVTFHAVRVPDDFELPLVPVTVDEVVARFPPRDQHLESAVDDLHAPKK